MNILSYEVSTERGQGHSESSRTALIPLSKEITAIKARLRYQYGASSALRILADAFH